VVVCHCQVVSDRAIRRAVSEGAGCPASVARACGAGSGCGGCRVLVDELIAESTGLEETGSRSAERECTTPG
jgi:bacterioferritin-associated ferredoxin